jgi:hypothetical protein
MKIYAMMKEERNEENCAPFQTQRGVKYMQAWEEKYSERVEGRSEGETLKIIAQI